MVWGIDDKTHAVVGTKFNRYHKSVGNQEIDSWLRHSLSRNAQFQFHELSIDDKLVTIIQIYPACHYPVSFKNIAYIRRRSYTKPLTDVPAIASDLWAIFRQSNFEELRAKEKLSNLDILNLLQYNVYFDRLHLPPQSSNEEILQLFEKERFIRKQTNGLWCITNLGALLLAKDFKDFPSIATRSIRVIQYQGTSKFAILKQREYYAGYATCLEKILDFIDAVTPSAEPIGANGVRQVIRSFSAIAIHELVVNAIIHQDFTTRNTLILIEIFDDRIVISNPGKSLVTPERIVDNPPQARNKLLAQIMRRMNFCEELGSGWDRSILDCELQFMPAPRIKTYENTTQVTMYTKQSFTQLSPETKVWNCYLHAVSEFLHGKTMNNYSLRKRFGLSDAYRSQISRLIKEAQNQQYIKPFNPNAAPRNMTYIPAWA